MHIAICDDNIDELSRIAALLEAYNRIREGTISYEAFHNAIDLLETMKKVRFDLLFLDILMPGTTGMEAARELRESNCNIPIIFLTSSREFAVESYRVAAEDYILKPARKDEIFPSLDKQLSKINLEEPYLTLKSGHGISKLHFSHIVYVEVINRSIRFALTKGDVREAYGYLTDFEKSLLSDSKFYKPHRSYIINLSKVTELNKDGFVTILGNTVPVARDAYAKAKAAYMKHLLSAGERRDKL